MDTNLYFIIHVSSVLLLAGVTFAAFAKPEASRRASSMTFGGILSLVVLVTGIGLMHKQSYAWSAGWVYVKLLVWLVVSGLLGTAFRRPGMTGILSLITAAAMVGAVYCVYLKPF